MNAAMSGDGELREAVRKMYLGMNFEALPEACLWCGGPLDTPKAAEEATVYEHREGCSWMHLVKVAQL